MLRSPLVALIPLALAACPSEGGGDEASTGNTTTTAGDSNDTIPTGGGEDPGFSPDYRQILSGTTVAVEYAKVRVGHLDDSDVDGCCADFVLAGPDQNHVRIMFGTSSRGLVFLSDVADQIYPMGPAAVGIEDVVVTDINNDFLDDVLALRSDGVVGIRYGLGATAPDPVLSDRLIEASLTSSMKKGARSLAVTDIDCLGKKDLVAVAPGDDGIVYAFATAGETFSSPVFRSTGAGTSPRQLATGDLNADTNPDIVTGNADGSASVLINQCSGFDVSKYLIFQNSNFSTPDMQVALGRVCAGASSKDWPAIALGYGQRVFIFCGSSTGQYSQIGEEPGSVAVTAVDYTMTLNANPVPDSAVYQLQYWEPTQSLLVLWSNIPEEFAVFDPSAFLKHQPLVNLHGRGAGRAFAAHQSRSTGGPEWSQAIVLVPGSGFTDVSFTR